MMVGLFAVSTYAADAAQAKSLKVADAKAVEVKVAEVKPVTAGKAESVKHSDSVKHTAAPANKAKRLKDEAAKATHEGHASK